MDIEIFENNIKNIINSELKLTEKSIELKKYIESNIGLIKNKNLVQFLINDSFEHKKILKSIFINYSEIANLFWDKAKSNNNNMIELFKNSGMFNNAYIKEKDEYVLSDALNYDITLLLHSPKQLDTTHLNRLISSDMINSMDFLLDKKEKINVSTNEFKEKLLKELLSNGLYFGRGNKKLTILNIALNIDNWQEIYPLGLREILMVIAIQKNRITNKMLKLVQEKFNEEFFNSLSNNNTELADLLLNTQCVPNKSFIKAWSKYEKIELNNWNILIEISDILLSKKLSIEEKSKRIFPYFNTIEDPFFLKTNLKQRMKETEGLMDFLFDYVKASMEKEILENEFKPSKENKENIILRKRI